MPFKYLILLNITGKKVRSKRSIGISSKKEIVMMEDLKRKKASKLEAFLFHLLLNLFQTLHFLMRQEPFDVFKMLFHALVTKFKNLFCQTV